VITGFGVELRGSEAAKPSSSPSVCQPFQEAIQLGLSRGCNARAIWSTWRSTTALAPDTKVFGDTSIDCADPKFRKREPSSSPPGTFLPGGGRRILSDWCPLAANRQVLFCRTALRANWEEKKLGGILAAENL